MRKILDTTGYTVYKANLKQFMDNDLDVLYDGIWNKFALNAFWHAKHENRHEAMLDAIAARLKPDAWSWIAPWNGVPGGRVCAEDKISHVLALQEKFFLKHGFTRHDLSIDQAKRYGINGNVANNCVYVKNLKWRFA